MAKQRMSLRIRIFVLLAAIVGASVVGGIATLWYFSRIETLLETVVDHDITALEAAAGLEAAMVMQKGFVSYYSLDGDPRWLEALEKYHHAFQDRLRDARGSAYIAEADVLLDRIEHRYVDYSTSRERVLQFYTNGEHAAGHLLHQDLRTEFLAIYDLCEQYKKIHVESIHRARDASRREVLLINRGAMVILPCVLLFALLLSYVLLKQVLGPIRRLAMEGRVEGTSTDADADTGAAGEEPADEVNVLSRRMHRLIDDVDRTQSKLRLSREHLVQSEKLATVGRLAAGVAHTIRNPLTSVKMRLFSLERSLKLSMSQKEDFFVISEEIRHIDAIVRNFLEFSRPPKLKVQQLSPSRAVDMALQLLRHRIESYGVSLELDREKPLPEISCDPEQLKEVLVNLLVNSCEVLTDGGRIVIRERESSDAALGRVAVIEVNDSGPGVPESVREKVFQPFFSTKEEGTGLGLSIAMRIVQDHGGSIEVESPQGVGATFKVVLPVDGGGNIGQNTDSR